MAGPEPAPPAAPPSAGAPAQTPPPRDEDAPARNGPAAAATPTAAGGRAARSDDFRRDVRDAVGGEYGEVLRSLSVALAGSRVQSGGVNLTGNIILGGEFIGGSRGDRAAGPPMLAAQRVRDDELTVVREAYLEPPLLEAARRALDHGGLVVLHGPAGSGKYAAGLRLLGRAESSTVWRLDSHVETTSQLLSFEYAEQSGYIVDTLAWDAAERLSRTFLVQLSRHLADRRSGLVLTVDARVRLDGVGREHVVSWEAPERRPLLERLLRWRLGEGPDRGLGVLDDERLARLLQGPLTVAQIDTLAGLLAEVARGTLVMEHALDRMHAGAHEVEQWFAEPDHASLTEYSFLVAVAVLSGASYQAVVQASSRLVAAFGARVPANADEIARRVVRHTRGSRVKESSARTRSGHEQLPYSRLTAPVEIVELEGEGRAQAVVRHVWYAHDLARPALTRWLEELGHHHSIEVRVRAARVAGDLMASEFGLLLGEVVMPWSRAAGRRPRLAAALALGVCAGSPAAAPVVRDLVAKWAELEDDDDLSLRWTAAAAYGYLGLNDPALALRALEDLLRSEERRLLGATGRSLAILFEAGLEAPAYYRGVLDLLYQCSTALDPEPTILGSLSVFLDLAEESEIRELAGGTHWPTVLWLMAGRLTGAEGDAAGRIAFELWRRALSHPEAQPWALEVLRAWIRRADDDDGLYPELERFARRLTEQSERERGRIVTWLRRWDESASRPRTEVRRRPVPPVERPSPAARRLHESLTARSAR